MLSLIICSRNPKKLSTLKKNIADTVGVDYELVIIDNSRNEYNIFSAYNEGVRRAVGDILCFMHEDIFYHTSSWGKKVYEHFEKENVGLIGVIGGLVLPSVPYISWWDGPTVGKYFQGFYDNDQYFKQLFHSIYSYTNKNQTAVAVDGLWFCIPAKEMCEMYFDEKTYGGFHCYDLDICMQTRKRGKDVVIVFDILIEHKSLGVRDRSFYEGLLKFYDKWESFLPQSTLSEPESSRYLASHQNLSDYYIDRCIDREWLNRLLISAQRTFPLNLIIKLKLICRKIGKIFKNQIKVIMRTILIQESILKLRLMARNPRVALCCIAKCENNYIREFVEHYLELGFDHITIYDNNDLDGERFEDVIGDYIESDKCNIVDFRGQHICQIKAYQEFYDSNKNKFDWMAFFDCDEFLTLKNHKYIHEFLAQSKFKKYQQIHINWLQYGDCGQLDTDGSPVQKRFPYPITPYQKLETEPFLSNNHTKTIIRGGLFYAVFTSPHCCRAPFYQCCDVLGQYTDDNKCWNPYDYSDAYLKHFSTKTIGEWIRIKSKRGFPDMDPVRAAHFLGLDYFFYQNERTPEKEEYAKQLLKEK